jgi:hypothetical protein
MLVSALRALIHQVGRRGLRLVVFVAALACALTLGVSLGAAAPGAVTSYPPPIIPYEPRFGGVEIAANPGSNVVTFTIRTTVASTPSQTYDIWATIPAGTEVIDTWGQVAGQNPAAVEGGRVKWQIKVPFRNDPAYRGMSAPYVFVVTWDGKTPLRTRAHVTADFTGWGAVYSSGDAAWMDENGQWHWEWQSDEIGVADPAVPTASWSYLRIRSLEDRVRTLEERVQALEKK